jgi:aryl-alcohol dehydrogenase-like predicted oxidoreductase
LEKDKENLIMEKRFLGTTDIEVSLLCLGTMTYGEQNTEAEAHSQLDYALDAGINFIDTAEVYPVPLKADTQGFTETHIGTWIQKSGKRSQVVLANKVAGRSRNIAWLRDGKPCFDRKNIQEALHSSLKRLQTDYLDLYQLHWPDRNTNCFGELGYSHSAESDATQERLEFLETLEVMSDLVKAGKVRHIGLSNETPWGVMQFLTLAETKNLPRVMSIQNPYSLLNRSFEVGLAEMAIKEQVSLLAYSPLAFGLLTGKYEQKSPARSRLALYPDYFSRYFNTEARSAATAYIALAKQSGLTPTELALGFVNRQVFLTSTIIGATTLEQLKDNIATATIKLSVDVLEEVERIHKQHPYPAP